MRGADRANAALAAAGLTLTSGGEPTFNARNHVDAPEWNGEALGPTKWTAGLALARELRRRLAPGAATLRRQGKWYPGEPLPRWALELIGLADGTPIWPDRIMPSAPPGPDGARHFAEALAARFGLPAGSIRAAYEDPWRFIMDEANLPVGVDPLLARLDDPAERRRLARILGGAPAAPVGYVLPLARTAEGWRTERWRFRREHLFLLPGDSPLGLRLPLAAIGGPPEIEPEEAPLPVPDPRLEEIEKAQAKLLAEKRKGPALPDPVRTALGVELREGTLFVFLPPVARAGDFLALVAAVDATRAGTGIDVQLEGYPPPSSPLLFQMAVTPDPGVLEVNLPPQARGVEHARLLGTVFEAALHAAPLGEVVAGRSAGRLGRWAPRHPGWPHPAGEPAGAAAGPARQPGHVHPAPPLALLPLSRGSSSARRRRPRASTRPASTPSRSWRSRWPRPSAPGIRPRGSATRCCATCSPT